MASASIDKSNKNSIRQINKWGPNRIYFRKIHGETLGRYTNIMQYIEKNDIPGLLLLIDFEKAFDSISWNFIHKVLRYFKFGPNIRQWITLFYKNAQLSVNQHCNLSPFFSISSRLSSGGPTLTVYIYLMRRNTCNQNTLKIIKLKELK